MKILKKFFLVSLFCSLFVVSASADTIDIQYTENIKVWVNEHTDLLDNVSQYINMHSSEIELLFNNDSRLDILNDKNVLFYPNISLKNNKIEVKILANFENNEKNFKMTGPYISLHYFTLIFDYDSVSNEVLSISEYSGPSVMQGPVSSDYFDTRFFDWRLGKNTNSLFFNEPLSGTSYDFILNSNNDILFQNSTYPGTLYDLSLALNYDLVNQTPSFELPSFAGYGVQFNENGSLHLTTGFNNYTGDGNYRISLYDSTNNIYYGVDNDLDNNLNKIVPFVETYEVDIYSFNSSSTYLLTLDYYEEIEPGVYVIDTIDSLTIDLHSITADGSKPYFNINYFDNYHLSGNFENVPLLSTCGYYFSDRPNDIYTTSCSKPVYLDYGLNGFIEFFVLNNDVKIYTRRVNVLSNLDKPFIKYNIEQKNGYSVLNWDIENKEYDSNMYYRISNDSGKTWLDFVSVNSTSFPQVLNMNNNSSIVIAIVDNTKSIIYDTKVIRISSTGFEETESEDLTFVSGLFSNFNDILPPGPIDIILTIPINMLNSLVSYVSGTCTPVEFTFPFVNYKFKLSCINSFYDNVGASFFFEITGVVASTIILINYFTFLYNWIDDILRLEHKKVKVWGSSV